MLRSRHARRRALVVVFTTFAMVAWMAGVALAFDSGGNPGGMGANSITWTGQGASGGVLNTSQCDGSNTAYLLWVFTTDGGTAHDAVLHLGGSGTGTFNADTASGSTFKFTTPYYTPDGSLTAYADFFVDTAGNGAWNLVISHGCAGEVPQAAAPTITKNAAGSFDDTHSWSIDKSVDKTYVEIQTDGGTATFNYTVTVTHGESVDSNYQVKGTVTVSNSNDADITLDSLTDELSDGTVCTFDDAPLSLVISPGDNDFDYTCDLGDTAPTGDLTNTASMAWSGQTLDDEDGSQLAAGSDSFTTPDPISFNANEIDECVDVKDSNDNSTPHTFCVGDAGEVDNGDGTYSFSFMYSKTFNSPQLGYCLKWENTASFETNDTGATGDDSVTVEVCRFNAPLTIGYWGNHLAEKGPSTCPTGLPNGTGCSKNGPWTVQYLGDSICKGTCTVGVLGYYDTGTGKDGAKAAAAVFAANNCSNASSSDSNAAACLAAQLLAAELNVANGANRCICDTINEANAFLEAVNYNGPGSAVTFDATHTRAQAIALKTALDSYNNNKGCPA
jgi:hypothetical protein